MLCSMKPILETAREGHYGVPAPNVLDYTTVDMSIKTAEMKKSPVILDVVFQQTPDLKRFINYVSQRAEEASVPVAINLDHGGKYEEIVQALSMDFSSVMVDRSILPFEENIKEVAEIVKIAHALGKSVEAELGHVGTNEGFESEGEAGGSITIHNEEDKKATFTKVDEAIEFVERTGVDCLAVAIGTVHGLYPKGFKPSLDFDLLKELRANIKVPLVVHGGSGSGDENLARACREGICKINICSDLLKLGREYLKEEKQIKCDNMIIKLLDPIPVYYNGYADKLAYYMDLFASTNKA